MKRAPCGCAREEDVVGTCPQCLPPGAITRLIENGRQLSLLPPDPCKDSGVLAFSEGDDSKDPYVPDSSEVLEAIRLEDPSF